MTRRFGLKYQIAGIAWAAWYLWPRNPWWFFVQFPLALVGVAVVLFVPPERWEAAIRDQIGTHALAVRRGDLPRPANWIARTLLEQPPRRR